MDLREHLVLIKGEDKTSSVVKITLDPAKAVYWVTFNNGKTYHYSTTSVRHYIVKNVIQATEKIVLRDDEMLFGVETVVEFVPYSRLFYKSGYNELVDNKKLKIIGSLLEDPKSANAFGYFKQIAGMTGLTAEDGTNILAAHYNKIDYIRNDSILGSFLSANLKNNGTVHTKGVIFPFGFNLSQKKAVENALGYKLSVIEGPPGTGKTQTILNIIANAVMRGETVAVVSSNNSATANVYEKLQKYGLEFIAAQLGNTSNKELFIETQTNVPPAIASFKKSKTEFDDLVSSLNVLVNELNEKLKQKNELSELTAKLDAFEKESEYFFDRYKDRKAQTNYYIPQYVKPADLLKAIQERQYKEEHFPKHYEKLSFFKKLALFFKLGFSMKKVRAVEAQELEKKKEKDRIELEDFYQVYYLEYYNRSLQRLKKEIFDLNESISENGFDFDLKMKDHSSKSMVAFRAKLAEKYTDHQRSKYSMEDLWRHSAAFLKDYPVILSTTYSLRSSLSKQVIYDYVIVDEASQVDLCTGVLALSCAKKAVVVGDLKQLPNVITRGTKEIADKIWNGYRIPGALNYAEHSLLSSLVTMFNDIPRVLLKEHYRCNPEIIGFCNQRFYNGELIVMTEAKNSENSAMSVYRTAAGNHARGHVNQRQIDVIGEEIIPQRHLNLNDGSLGIVTPYRNQANELQRVFAGTKVKADTADKFQGQEKKVIIFSTVDNEIGEFASDPNRLNVAVSRAIDEFIVVTDGNDNDNKSPIHDLIGYIGYHNHEIINSTISSVFDNLYKQSFEAREEIMKKYGKVSEYDSENLMFSVIKSVLAKDEYSVFDVAAHVPFRMLFSDLSKLEGRELTFASNHLTHVDFLIYSKLTHMPVLVIEVDGFAYHKANEEQLERDRVKDEILKKYGIPEIRFSTVGSGETQKLEKALKEIIA